MINITDAAVNKILANLSRRGKGVGIRIVLNTTGCSGYSTAIEFLDEILDTDVVYEKDGAIIAIDKSIESILIGSTIDYERNGLNEGFSVSVPNECSRCGCGKSFRLSGSD